MKEFIEVYKMHEISVQTRIKILFQLGEFTNAKYACNIAEPIVYELVKSLDPTYTCEWFENFEDRKKINEVLG